MAKTKEELNTEATELSNSIASQKANAEALDELGKITGISIHTKGYSLGVKTIEGNDLKKVINIDALKEILMSEFNSEALNSKLKETQAAADAAK